MTFKKVNMKNFFQPIFIFTVVISLFAGCTKIKKPEAQIERENWIAGFKDSVEYYQKRYKEIESRLEHVNEEVKNSLNSFELINNPREVTGYYLLKGWSKKLPFTSTAIYARLSQEQKIELIATLAGGTFNRIGVGVENIEIFSETVPHDQAFNYRHQSYNTVFFSGGKADTIAQYIARNKDKKITLEFLENSIKKNFIIPEDEKKMIAETWNLYEEQMQSTSLQKELWICSRKIDTFRRFMEEQKLSNQDTEN